MQRIGLKLWSTNTDYYLKEAKRLYAQGIFDYIELYVVPDTLKNICKWKSTNIPFALHAPHFRHGVNLADKNKKNFNASVFSQVKRYFEKLDAKFVVVHGGIEGSYEELIEQFSNIIYDNRDAYLLENKPYYTIDLDKKCRGACIEEVKLILEETKCHFCLDIGHAICTANVINEDPYVYVEKFENLLPTSYHLSDNEITNIKDQHLHFGDGNIDFKKVFRIIQHNKYIAIETNKNHLKDLNDFILDSYYIKKLN